MPLGLPAVGPAPAPRQTITVPPATWTFATGPWQQLPNNELPSVTSRKVTWRLVGNHEASFTIDATRPDAAAIQELISDLWVYRNGFPLYRGRVGASSDTADGTTHTTSFSSADYRALLARRFLLDGDVIAGTGEESLVAFNLIQQSQLKPGGSWGIVRGLSYTIGTTSVSFTAGASILDSINLLAQTYGNGFEWDIQPVNRSTAMTFDMWAQRGTDRQTVLDYPGRIASFSRQVDPGAYANVVRASGANGVAPATVAASNIATAPAGRFETQVGETLIQDSAGVALFANQKLTTMQAVTPVWTVTLDPNSWGGPTDFWLGDPVILAVRSGRLQVLGVSLRVYEIALTLDDASDTETVQVTLGGVNPDRRWLLRTLDNRLTTLERR